jgi:pimeloyl-ACP methyl ester carboxylesterase
MQTNTKQRLFLFPGFSEDVNIFSEMMPLLTPHYEVICPDYRPLFDVLWENNTFHIASFVELLEKEYLIKEDDLLVGHSFGGWVATNLQQRTKSKAVLLASFSHPHKVRRRHLLFSRLAQFLTKRGLFKWSLLHKSIVRKYLHLPTLPAIQKCVEVMKTWDDKYLLTVAKLIHKNPPVSHFPYPILRFHGDKDTVVAPPEEEYILMEGKDHFILHTDAPFLVEKIRNF